MDISYGDFTSAVRNRFVSHPNERRGQATFNTLFATRPDLAEKVRATNLDPFYDDSKLHEFYNFIEENW